MAILEVHDGQGRVQRVALRRDEPCIFGSSPACTVVINDPAVAAVHGRIQWRKEKYKIDAGTGVDSLEVNGKRIRTSTLHQGDEIRVGLARIFVISTEDLIANIPENDKTRVQAPPKALGTASTKATARPAKVFGSAMPADVRETPVRPEPLKRTRSWRQNLEAAEPVFVATSKEKPGFGAWLRSRIMPASDAPGQERVISSPMVVGLVITLAILVLASFGLWKVIVKSTSQKQFTKAFDSLNEGDYRNAIKQLDQFLAAYPEDNRSGKAKVFRSLAKVRQFTSNTGASWPNALQAAQEMVSEVGGLDEYRDASTELAEQLVKVVEGLADHARAAADREALQQAESALALYEQVAGKSSENMISRSRIPTKLAQAREAIKRAETKARGMAAMNAAITASSANNAYSTRDKLVAAYPDLATDRELIAGLLKANELIRKAVSFDPAQRPGKTEPRPDPLGPSTTLVLRAEPGKAPSAVGSVVYAIADGLAIGLDAATGAPLWQAPVGLSSPFAPLPIAGGDPSALVIDARFDELVRLDGRTGKLVWRQEIGERVVDPPLVVGNEILMATPSGKVLFLDLNNGTLRGTLNVGRPLTRSPVVDESGLHLFVLGQEDVLFILDRDPPACVAVEYLSHETGVIASAPARVGRFLVVAENSTLKDGRWRVFVLDETGAKIVLKQTIPVAGWTWQTPANAGSVIWSLSDRGAVVAYSIGLYDAEEPFKPIASLTADTEASGPAFGLARSERELWVSSSRSGRFDLNPESGKLAATWLLGQSGSALAPVQNAEKLAIFTQQSIGSPGLALFAVDPPNGVIRWRTTLGAPWPLPTVAGKESGSIETLGFDGSRMSISREQLAVGGFIEQPLAKPGVFRVPALGARWFSCGEVTVLVPAPTADHLLVRDGEKTFRSIDLPSPLGARPIAWGKEVLVPGGDGRVYLIDPLTGEFAADPYVPRFDKAHVSVWRNPVLLEGDAVAVADHEGRVRRLTKAVSPRPRLVVSAETHLGKPITTEPASTGGSVLVATSDGKVRALVARDLSPASTIDLPAPLALGPVAVENHGFVSDVDGNVVTFAADGRKLWQTKLGSSMSEPPALLDGAAWFFTRSGRVESRNLTSGVPLERLVLGVLPTEAPIVVGPMLIVPSGLGSFRPILNPRNPSSVRPSGG